MKEYRLGEWVDLESENVKPLEKTPIQGIARDIYIIRCWVQFFGITSVVVGVFWFFIWLLVFYM
jgi:hypothetical protein